MPPNRGSDVLTSMGVEMARLSDWFDDANAWRDPEAITWGRMAKLSEEVGEVIQEMILNTGQNPRKGQSDRTAFLIKENLDVAMTALGNVEHLTGNNGTSLFRLLTHLGEAIARAESAGMRSVFADGDEDDA